MVWKKRTDIISAIEQHEDGCLKNKIRKFKATCELNQAAKFSIKITAYCTYPEPAVLVDSMLSIRSLFAISFKAWRVFWSGLWYVSSILLKSSPVVEGKLSNSQAKQLAPNPHD